MRSLLLALLLVACSSADVEPRSPAEPTDSADVEWEAPAENKPRVWARDNLIGTNENVREWPDAGSP